jgi:DNA-binding beta-propeller fold protein YncE
MSEGDLSMIRYLRLSLYLPLLLILPGRALAALTLADSVPISPQPLTVAVEAGTHRVFVADADLGAVVLFDDSTGMIGGTINVGGQPSSLAVDNQGHRLFIGNRDTVGPSVWVADTGTGNAKTLIPAGHRTWCLAYDEQINRLYVGDPDARQLLAVDGTSGQTVGQVPLGGAPVAIAVNPSNGEIAIAVQGNAPALAVIGANDLTGNALMIPVPNGQPTQVAVDSATGKFFVVRSGQDPALLVLRPQSTAFDNSIPVNPGVTGIAIDRNSQIYLSRAIGVASVIDGTTGNPVGDVPIGAASDPMSFSPNHAAVDPDSVPTRVYMVDTASGVLSIFNGQ